MSSKQDGTISNEEPSDEVKKLHEIKEELVEVKKSIQSIDETFQRFTAIVQQIALVMGAGIGHEGGCFADIPVDEVLARVSRNAPAPKSEYDPDAEEREEEEFQTLPGFGFFDKPQEPPGR